MCVKCFSAKGWRNIQPIAVLEAEASFQYKGVSIRIRRQKNGRCEWMGRTSWNEHWHDVGETLRNRLTKAEFRFDLRRACHKLGVRY